MSDSLQPHWIVAHQAPLSMGFSRQEYWSGLHSFLQGIFLTQGLKLCLLRLLHCRKILYHWATREAWICVYVHVYVWGRIDTCIHHSSESITILLISYNLIENKKFQINRKKKKREKTRIQLLKKASSDFYFPVLPQMHLIGTINITPGRLDTRKPGKCGHLSLAIVIGGENVPQVSVNKI